MWNFFKSKQLFILVFSGWLGVFHTASATPSSAAPAEQAYLNLIRKSAANLNIGSASPEDSIISLCHRVEALGRAAKNRVYIYKAGQLQVNAYGQAGALGLAANKAQDLLDEATKEKDPLGMGLAIQAIGDTYMYTNRYIQADSVFQEAEPYITRNGDETMRIQLALQQLFIYVNIQDTTRLKLGLEKTRQAVAQSTLPEKSDYDFLLDCYQGFHSLQTGKPEQAAEMLKRLRQKIDFDPIRYMWVNYLTAQYHESIGAYDQALDYVDTLLNSIRQQSNKDLLREMLSYKAGLLERAGNTDDACAVYQTINHLIDSLGKNNYLSQIDSLHVTYWIDHLQMDNIARRDSAYTKVISGLLALVAGAIALGVYIRRSNRKLRESRLRLEAMRKASADSIHSKSLFLSNMSHELRTPLNAIMGFSTILTEEETAEDEETRLQCGAYIRQNADLLLKLIGDVVDFSSLQGNSLKFTYATCNVVELCSNVLQTIQNVKRTEAELFFVTDLDTLELCTDPGRLQQVLINLMINSTNFTKTGSITLRLAIDAEHDEAVFSVEDTGCGIPLDRQPRIFERFEKLHEGTQGAGLGLSICKLIVEHFGGHIGIDSAYTQGARFVFTHPLHFTPSAPGK